MLTRRHFLAATGLTVLGGCAAPDANDPHRGQPLGAVHEAIYGRDKVEFLRAALIKPADGVPEGLIQTFLPLFLFEVRNPQDPASRSTARPGPAFPGLLEDPLEATFPVVHALVDEAFVGGQARARVSFLWLQSRVSGGEQRAFTTQGIRITVDRQGRPAFWEVLKDSTKARILFVNAATAEAAATTHGAVLPGRRHAIERSVAEAPNIVVARVIDDGPTPMGPILYVRPDTGDIVTIVCRCMASQAREVVGTEEYGVYGLDVARAADARAAAVLGRGFAGTAADDLGQHLRLPPE